MKSYKDLITLGMQHKEKVAIVGALVVANVVGYAIGAGLINLEGNDENNEDTATEE